MINNNKKGLKMKNNIEMIYEDDSMNVEIIRRKDDNRVFKLCYDNGDSLCEVYKLVNEVYVDSDNEEVYG